MHDTAMELGKRFFQVYASNKPGIKIVDVGAQDVNGSLRSVAPPNVEYVGVDFVEGQGVDVIITDPYALPFEDNSVDVVVCSSCFEHSEFFWLLFNEVQRMLRPSGVFYLNVPSNGAFHRYPVDCWRFYPDSGIALQNWARKNGYKTTMVESFTGDQKSDIWNDFVGVFIKDPEYLHQYPNRMIDSGLEYTNGLVHGSEEFRNKIELPQDRRLFIQTFDDLRAAQAEREAIRAERDAVAAARDAVIAEREALKGKIQTLRNTLKERTDERDSLAAERDAIVNSRSWKLTSVLRDSANQLRRVRSAVRSVPVGIAQSGGVKKAVAKAVHIYRQEGVSGLRQRFTKAKGLYAARPTYAFPCAEFLTGISRQAHEVLAPRVLIIAELSIPQCTKYRVTQKKEMIQHLGLECEVLSWTEPAQCLRALSTFSMVIFYRVPAFQSVINIMDEARRLNLMTYWEVDDLIFDREVLRTSRTLARLEPQVFQQILDGADLYRSAMARCARGIASTTGLAAAMQADGLVDTFVVENALDKETVAVANRINNAGHIRDDSVVRIVYGSGTNTHNEDFAVVAPVLIDIFQKYPQVHFRLIGKLDLPSEFEAYRNRIERIPFCNYEEYLNYVAECDINIAPLEEGVFNDAKSNIKFLEASCVKLPSVCSPRAAFSGAIKHGETGYLCSTTAEWFDALSRLVEDAELRHEVGAAAHRFVHEVYAPSHVADYQVAPLLHDHQRSPKKRVLSVNIYYSPRSFGGSTIVAEEVNKRLHASGDFDVYVFTTLPLNVVDEHAVRRYEVDGQVVFGVGTPALRTPREMFESEGMLSAFKEVLAAVQPDIVHFHCVQDIGVTTLEYCKDQGIPYVVTLHDAWWLCGRQFMVNREGVYCGQHTIDLAVCARCVDDAALNDYRQDKLRTALEGAAQLLTPSQYFADFYKSNGFDPSSVTVNKNGIQLPKSAQKIRSGGPLRFGYVGGNSRVKGVHHVTKVFAELGRSDVKLVVVDNAHNLGFSSYEEGDFKGIPQVEIVPGYTQATIDRFFDSIDVLLFPTQAKESFGLVVREALARNVWVISTDSGGAVEDIRPGENGLVIPMNDDGTALKQAVLDTIAYYEGVQPGEAVHLNSPQIASFDDQAAGLARVYQEALEKNQRLPLQESEVVATAH